MSLTLWDLVCKAKEDSKRSITKEEFNRIMHDPDATEEEIAEALRMKEEAGGYENLGD